MSDYTDLLELFKQRRRNLIIALESDDEFDTASRLADVQSVITAIEAVMAEPEPVKTRPLVECAEDGWLKA